MKANGKELASVILKGLGRKPAPKKFLAAFLAGDDPASASFLKQKEKTAKELGVDFRLYPYPVDITNDVLQKEVGKITAHKTCGGAIVQLPLPKHLNAQYILNAIPREKDVDVLGERALGAFYTGRNPVLPPAVGVVKLILETYNVQLANLKTAVVGRGLLVGKPIAMWLIDKVAELAVFTSRTKNLGEKLKNFDLIVTGVGKAGLIKPEYLKEGAGVIDFGYDSANGELRGDFDVSQLKNLKTYKLTFYTPTPGGTGPILVAKLLENFYTLNA
jgi:methylenetetrahydrofolate dehydrogenase (NADP+)/methenyltetrahydrofolate cyclohydrolase